MPYETNTDPFNNLHNLVNKLPEELPDNPQQLEEVLRAYIAAFECLLQLVKKIMEACIKKREKDYVSAFLKVYDEAALKIIQLLDKELEEALIDKSQRYIELVYAIRDSQISLEVVILSSSLADSEMVIEPEKNLDTATVVTNSFKEQIKKYSKRSWIESVLHTINEIISIIRGVV